MPSSSYAGSRDVHVCRTRSIIVTGGFAGSACDRNTVNLEPRTAVGNCWSSMSSCTMSCDTITHYGHRPAIPCPVGFPRTCDDTACRIDTNQ